MSIGIELVPVDATSLNRLPAQEHILAHRHAGDQGQFLVHDSNALFGRLLDGAVLQPQLLALAKYVPLVLPPGIYAGQDLHQGRLARSVLAANPVDLAAPELNGHVAQGRYTREFFGDILDIENDVVMYHKLLLD